MDSTERSISPVMMIGVMARAMIEISMTACDENPKLGPVRKKGDSWTPHQTSTMRMTTRNNSMRAMAESAPKARLTVPTELPPAGTETSVVAGDRSGFTLAAPGS